MGASFIFCVGCTGLEIRSEGRFFALFLGAGGPNRSYSSPNRASCSTGSFDVHIFTIVRFFGFFYYKFSCLPLSTVKALITFTKLHGGGATVFAYVVVSFRRRDSFSVLFDRSFAAPSSWDAILSFTSFSSGMTTVTTTMGWSSLMSTSGSTRFHVWPSVSHTIC